MKSLARARWVLLLAGSLFLGRVARGADTSVLAAVASGASSTKFVPIVLDLAASGEHFTTEVTLANRGTTTAAVLLTYTPSTFLAASGGGQATLNLPPGRQLVETDTIAWLRGLGIAIPTGSSQGGTLLVAFTGLSSPDAAWVSARTTTPSGPGRAGLSYRGVDLGEALFGSSCLYGLRSSPSDRTNLALANASMSAPVTLRVTLCSGAAGDSRTFTLVPDTTLGPGQWIQYGKILDQAGFTNGYAKVDLVSGTGPYVAYAVFNDLATNDGSYVAAESASMPSEMRLLPVLVESATFQSELVLTNPHPVPQTATLVYVESSSPSGGAGGTLTLSFQPGEQKIIESAIDFLRQNHVAIGPKGSATFAGSLAVTFYSGTSVSSGFVGARTAAPVAGTPPGEYGLFYPGVGPSFAALNEAWAYGLRQDTGDRSNMAVVNMGDTGDPMTFKVDVYDGETGQLAGSLSPATPAPLAPGGWTQIGAVLRSFGVTKGYLHVTKLTGNDHFLLYAVVNDGGAPGQGTSDGSYVAGQVIPSPAALTWIPGSSVKVEQILGDCDWPDLEQRSICTPTASQTITKNDVEGTDLGYSFETPAGLMFLFGDTLGTKTLYHAGDTTALSTTTDPEARLLLNFLTNTDGSTYLIQPPGVVMGPDDVPNAGITLNGQIYLICTTRSDTSLPDPHVHNQSVFVRFDPATKGLTTLRTISTLPGGHFTNPALHASGSDVLVFGIGDYRNSDVYLAVVPGSSIESGTGTRYFAGLVNGQPTWSDQESGAVPIVVDNPLGHTPPDAPTIGNVSVTFSPDLGLWLMTYDGGRQTEATNGVYLCYAPNPWGPWSQPQLIFNAKRDHALGVFIHDPSLTPDDLLHGPTINPAGNPPATTRGGAYAPFQIERFMTVSGDTLKIYFTLSTWNPYTVVRMRSEFTIAHAP